MEDTEWNDILRQKGILPPKQQEEPVERPDTPDPRLSLDIDEIDALLDDDMDDDRILAEIRYLIHNICN
jgi:hypothetical protein